MANGLYARLLGGFSLSWPERDGPGVVGAQGLTGQVAAFLAYLCVYHQNPVAEEELIRALWGDSGATDPVGTLRMVLQRARTALEGLGFPDGKNILLYRRGVFCWMPGLEVHPDTEELDRLCAAFAADPEGRLEEALEFLPRCAGEFLPHVDRAPWVSAMRTRCRGRYLQLLRGAADQLGRLKRYDEAILLCRTATELDPYDEWSQILLMRLLHLSGATQSALWHYKAVSKLYIDQLGIAPGAKMSACYQEIARHGKTEEPDLQSVRKRLEQGGSAVRPMYCEYPVFRSIYQFMARTMVRTGYVVQLAMLTVLERDGTPPSVTRCGAAMETLKTSGLSSLREGDVCTRLSPNQYLLLLPTASEDDARMTLTRCLAAFERTPIGQSVAVHTGVLPVEPIEV